MPHVHASYTDYLDGLITQQALLPQLGIGCEPEKGRSSRRGLCNDLSLPDQCPVPQRLNAYGRARIPIGVVRAVPLRPRKPFILRDSNGCLQNCNGIESERVTARPSLLFFKPPHLRNQYRDCRAPHIPKTIRSSTACDTAAEVILNS